MDGAWQNPSRDQFFACQQKYYPSVLQQFCSILVFVSMLFVCTELPSEYAEKMQMVCYDNWDESWKDLIYNKKLCFHVHVFVHGPMFRLFLVYNLAIQVVFLCPEWQEEMSPKTQGVSPTIVNEGNDGNEAGRKMWGQGEISRKVVQSVSCRGNRWTQAFRTRLKKEN